MCMRIRTSPQTELNPLFIPLADVVPEREVQFHLDSGMAVAVPFGKAKERPIARVLRECFSQSMSFRKIDAEILEPLEEIRPVRVEQNAEVYSPGIGAPFEEKIEEIE